MILFKAIRALLRGIWTVLQPAMRFLGWVLALAASIAFITDWSSEATATGGMLAGQSFAGNWQRLAPDSFASFQAMVETELHPLAWDPVLQNLFDLPMWLSFAVLAASLLYFSRQRNRITVFAN